jgi:hypothetical protein
MDVKNSEVGCETEPLLVRFKVLKAIIIVFFLMLGFWSRVDVLAHANVSEKRTVPIFHG